MKSTNHTEGDPVSTGGGFTRPALLIALTVAAAFYTFTRDKIPQDAHYHHFADARKLAGVANFSDVVSNVPFLMVGGVGMTVLIRTIRVGSRPTIHWFFWPYLLFFVGISLTAFGSIYYHLHPSNSTLLWDRLPMTVAFMAFLAIVLQERIDQRFGLLLAPLILLGAASALHWHVTESRGAGDLRLYGFVQFYPMLLIPIIIALYPRKYIRAKDIGGILGLYVLAKGFELADRQVYELTGFVSGHTLKHLVAALAALWVVGLLTRQTRYANATPWPAERAASS